MRLFHFLMALFVIVALIGVSSFYRTDVSLADDEDGVIGFVNYEDNGTMVCRDATTEEAREMLQRDPDVRLRPISPIRPNQTGLKIILRGTQQLDSFPEAKAAFVRAAAKWEGLIQNPITIIIDVDFGPTRFGRPYGPGVIGSTTLPDNIRPYEDIRTRILSKTSSQLEASLYNMLPAGSVPTDLGSATSLTLGTPQLRALDILPAVADSSNEPNPPAIGFNSNFSFDFDPSNGIDAVKTDFDAVAVHEIGHALGFVSSTGDQEVSPSSTLAPTIWDLFRFRPGTTLSTFQTAPRIQSSGGTQVFFSGGPEAELSTGRFNNTGGDGRQASHWKDDAIVSKFIGIMDPSIGRGVREQITQNDVTALDAFGYQVKTSENDNTPPIVSVLRPGTGETAIIGNQFNIRWASSDDLFVARHDIDLSTDGGLTFTTSIATGLSGSTNAFVWTVPDMEVSNARIRVTAFDGANNRGFNSGTGDFIIAKFVAPDFQLLFNPAQLSVARGQSSRFTLNITRNGGFNGNVTVTAPDTKAIKVKISQPTQSTTGTSLSFDFKVKKKAQKGSQQLTFSGKDDSGRVRTGIVTLLIQ